MTRYVVTTREVKHTSQGIYMQDVTCYVDACSEVDAMRAALVPGDNAFDLPRGSSVVGCQVGPMKPLSESLVVGVVGVEEYEPEEGQ